jgi:lysophospholipase L1-like esterase
MVFASAALLGAAITGAACDASTQPPAPAAGDTPIRAVLAESRQPTPAPAEIEHFVAIGDSITGTGVHAPEGWVKQFAAIAGAGLVTNLAENGWTTGQLLFAVQYHARYRDALRSADLITVNAGMNEFFMGRDIYSKGDCGGGDGMQCLRHMVERFEGWWTELIAEIRALAPAARIIVLSLYHPLEAFDQHFGWDTAVRAHLGQMNDVVEATEGVEHVDLYEAFNGADGRGDPIGLGYILPDAIHATGVGHGVIAALLADAG